MTPSSRLLVGEQLLLTLWVGSQWAIGYIAVPVLFHSLDNRALAGNVAGEMFTVVYLIGLVAGPLLLASLWFRAGPVLREWRFWVIAAMVVLVAIGMFVVQPMMQDLKTQGELVKGSELAARFGRLHGVSSAMYLVTSLLGLALVVFGRRDD
ncbi:MAG: hypothetical protein FD165_406 [Gammaproteobacteria bacterium]|nr:MAG: hypothetical protein FD165_406 [Gammaproteobacteria bacterium]TND04775.1 MAG: hypothetical protein FD120_1342 [Gammaproteobacteria bacterium]